MITGVFGSILRGVFIFLGIQVDLVSDFPGCAAGAWPGVGLVAALAQADSGSGLGVGV